MNFADRTRAALWRVPVGLQLSALYTLLLVTILALLGWALYAQLDGFLVNNTASRLEAAAGTTLVRSPGFDRGGDLHPPSRRGDSGTPPNQAAAPSPYARSTSAMIGSLVRQLSAPDVTVAVLTEQGQVISSTLAANEVSARQIPTLPTGWINTIPTQPVASGSAATAQWIVPAETGGRLLVVAQVLNTDGGIDFAQGRLLLVQVASLDAADAILNQLRLYLVLGLIIGTVVGVLAGLGLTRAVLKPLDRMADTAEAIAGGDLNRRLRMPAPAGGNEVARLGGAFDHMVDRLAASLQAQRRFIADASHELRTPLTSLEGLSEMLLIGADRGDSSTIQRMARSMHGELGRMGRLVTDLLTLSKLDNAGSLSVTSVEVGKLLDDIAEQVEPLADNRQIRLEVIHDGPVPVRADPDRLKQVILNLVDNALRYTPPGGTVRLAAAADLLARTVRIQVQDTGPGIAPDHLLHIFDRFYRGDPSRTRASGNTGLGLAIARGIIEAHQGTIEVQSVPGTGACFTIVLPGDGSGESHGLPLVPRRDRQPVNNQQ